MAKSGGNSSKKERVNLRKKSLENGSLIGSSKVDHVPFENNLIRKERIENKEHKLSGKKRKEKNYSGADVDKVDQLGSPGEDVSKKLKYEESIEGKDEKKKRKLSKKKREKQNVNGADVDDIDQPAFEVGDSSKKLKHGKSIEGKEEKKKKKLSKKIEKQNVNGANVYEFHHPFEVVDSTKKPKRKTKKAVQKEKKDEISSGKVTQQIKEESRSVASEVYQISSVDVDPSKGMKKWITEYHQRRPGLNILQQRIDEFITSHEEREEQAKAHSAEEGWTVVEHHKGRKRTTDAESGVAVGSVAQAAVLDKMGKKKVKDVGPDFYRFQRREAQRNEIMMLQSKFEQDKKRIQQLRAARKFRPY